MLDLRIDDGVAGNVISDAASVTVNSRFGPDRTPEAALAHVQDVFDGLAVSVAQIGVVTATVRRSLGGTAR